jgi:hypothetical protein
MMTNGLITRTIIMKMGVRKPFLSIKKIKEALFTL